MRSPGKKEGGRERERERERERDGRSGKEEEEEEEEEEAAICGGKSGQAGKKGGEVRKSRISCPTQPTMNSL